MIKREIIDSIYNDCNVRLKPSKVCGGVGVFSIKSIKKGEIIFKDVTPDNVYIKFSELDGVDENVLTYLKSMCNSDEKGLYLSRTVNNINISYFINHSNNPNIIHDLKLDIYYAIKDISIGDELVCEYMEKELW
jgi:SET domain-containing protein